MQTMRRNIVGQRIRLLAIEGKDAPSKPIRAFQWYSCIVGSFASCHGRVPFAVPYIGSELQASWNLIRCLLNLIN